MTEMQKISGKELAELFSHVRIRWAQNVHDKATRKRRKANREAGASRIINRGGKRRRKIN
jgi:hypothetical protein